MHISGDMDFGDRIKPLRRSWKRWKSRIGECMDETEVREMEKAERVRLAMELHEIEEMRVSGHLGEEEAQEYRMAAVLGFYNVNEDGIRRPDFFALSCAILDGEVPGELCNIKYDEDGNGTVCDCEACKERRGW